MCPYFCNFGIFVFIVFDGNAVRCVFFNGVFDLIELLPHIVCGVVLGGRVTLAGVLSSFPDTPVKCRYQTADPGHGQNGAQ